MTKLGPANVTSRVDNEIRGLEWSERIAVVRLWVKEWDDPADCCCLACEALHLAEAIVANPCCDRTIGRGCYAMHGDHSKCACRCHEMIVEEL